MLILEIERFDSAVGVKVLYRQHAGQSVPTTIYQKIDHSEAVRDVADALKREFSQKLDAEVKRQLQTPPSDIASED